MSNKNRFEIFTDVNAEFRFRLIANNGKIIAQSEGYKSKRSAKRGVKSVIKNSRTAEVVDLT